MKIAMIGTRGVPAHYGGFETAVEEIGSRLAAAGHEVVVFCRPVPGEPIAREYRGMQLVHLPALRRRSLETLSHTALSVVNPALNGVDAAIVFNAANSPFLPILKARRIPLATHVDGLEWRRSKWGPAGRRYYRIAESLAVRWSDALIADATGIADYYRVEFGAQTRQIAYGAPVVDSGSDRLAELDLEPGEYHLVVARFERENHVLEIVKGYVAGDSVRPLVIVGSAPYSGEYSAQITAAADSRVRLLGGIWDNELLDQLYANAAAYLHGHSVGGTNPSLLRAVGAGTPTIAFDSVFNREVLGSAGIFFADQDALTSALAAFDADPDSRTTLSAQLVAVAARYRWDDVAKQYEKLCLDLAAGVRNPSYSGRRSRPGWRDGVPAPDTVLVAHPSPDLYGSDRVLLESVAAFVEDGRRTVVALPGAGPLAEALEERGAEVAYCPSPVLRKSALRPLGLVHLAAESLAAVRPATRLMDEYRPDLVFVNTLTIPLWPVLARLRGLSVVTHVHEAERSISNSLRKLLYAPLLLASRVLVNSGFSADVIADTWPLLARRTALLYNGVPGPADAVSPPGPRPEQPRLLFIGRLSPRKGPQIAIEALAQLRERGVEARLGLLGAVFDGYEWFEDDLRRQVAELGLVDHVDWLGFDPQVWPHLAAADVVLVPSTVDEPFGNTAVEAMLAERPLVVSRTSGLVEAAAGYSSARFVTPSDPADLAAAVIDLLDDWSRLRSAVVSDRERALARHAPPLYRRRLAALCRPGPIRDPQLRTTEERQS